MIKNDLSFLIRITCVICIMVVTYVSFYVRATTTSSMFTGALSGVERASCGQSVEASTGFVQSFPLVVLGLQMSVVSWPHRHSTFDFLPSSPLPLKGLKNYYENDSGSRESCLKNSGREDWIG